MGEKESHDAAVEARHDIAQRRRTPAEHLNAIARYLAGVAYQTAHDKKAGRKADGGDDPRRLNAARAMTKPPARSADKPAPSTGKPPARP